MAEPMVDKWNEAVTPGIIECRADGIMDTDVAQTTLMVGMPLQHERCFSEDICSIQGPSSREDAGVVEYACFPEAASFVEAVCPGPDGLATNIQASLRAAVVEVLAAVDAMSATLSPESLLQGERAIHAAFTRAADEITSTVLQEMLADPTLVEVAVGHFRTLGYQVQSRKKRTSVQLLGGRQVPVSTVYMLRPRKKRAAKRSEVDGGGAARASIPCSSSWG